MNYVKELRRAIGLVDNAGPQCAVLLVKKYGSLRKAAERVGVSYVHLCRVKNRQAMPTTEMILKMLAKLEGK